MHRCEEEEEEDYEAQLEMDPGTPMQQLAEDDEASTDKETSPLSPAVPLTKQQQHQQQQQQPARQAAAGGRKRPSTEKRVRFSERDEVFRPSYETFTPAVNPKAIEYRAPSQRVATAIAPASSVARPNYDDALRRVAIVVRTHVMKCEERVKNASADDSGPFHRSKLELFAEENFVTPQYRYTFVRSPVARMGVCYSLQKVKQEYNRPTVEEVYEFIRTLFTKAQLSSECSIVCLIYVERLMEHANVPLTSQTWRPILLCGLLLASKVWQDLSSWNIEFSSIYPQFSLQSINRLERMMCHHIKWDLYISSSLYAKYYFALRSLTEKKDFRHHYNITMKVNPPKADQIQQRSGAIGENLVHMLSKSV